MILFVVNIKYVFVVVFTREAFTRWQGWGGQVMQPESGVCLNLARFRLRGEGSEFRVGFRQVCICAL